VRFLVDECLSVRLAPMLVQAEHDAVHVDECGLSGQPDEQVLGRAADEGRVLLSTYTDFGEILARTRGMVPSVVLIRRGDRSPASLLAVLLANLDQVADDLEKGAFVVITDERMRVRPLPIGG
jgi:predicted nuclease of predicted toxin-antitoxin system